MEGDRMRFSSLRLASAPLGLAAVVIVLVGAAQIASPAQPNERTHAFSRQCDEWDRAASAAMTRLIAARDPVLEQRLGDAVFRLRRARKYCRHDLTGLAWLDYRALTDGRYHHP
jgi:hypothetical protein